MAAQTVVQTHSYQHFEDLQLSATEFYDMLEMMILEYKFPNISIGTKTMRESGILSSSRLYLRICKDNYEYYVCAAPFGRSFFISWWLQKSYSHLDILLNKLLGQKKKSFYEMDTELIFKNSIDTIVKQAVEKVSAGHGFKQNS